MTTDDTAPPSSSLTERLRAQVRSLFLRYVMTRRAIRNWETGLILMSAIIGAGVGVLVVAMRQIVYRLHTINFGLPPGEYLSAQTSITPVRLLLVPATLGLLLGFISYLVRKYRANDIVDPIEANALYGGRMSMIDSIRLAASTMLSNAAGASVGMEAGYTQIGASLFSYCGSYLRLRRDDLRIFVTAGAAAAIAAAFNAPLTGAFYGFELIFGSYTIRALAPVAIAALSATISARVIGGPEPLFLVTTSFNFAPWAYVVFALIGVAAAGFGILTMRAVTFVEARLKKLPVSSWLRPAIGGALLSFLALGSPQVLGSGHGAIQYQFEHPSPLYLVAALLVGKFAASAISLGAGFRGGLFSSSLFLGCLFGATIGQALAVVFPSLGALHIAFMLVGMSAIAASIIGAPITMVFLILEGTGDFSVSMAALVGVVMASTITRLNFGYSFSTWRFHIRGVSISGAHDVGWIADMTVAKLMRTDPIVMPVGMPLVALRKKVPLGAAKRIFVVDDNGRYQGGIDVATVHDPDLTDAAPSLIASDLSSSRGFYLLSNENVRVALTRFEAAEAETLPVLDTLDNLHVVGFLTEAYALRRYTQELERKRGQELGASDLFPLGKTGPLGKSEQ